MSILLLTDSAADYEPNEWQAQDIILVPISIIFDQETFFDGINLSKDEFYDRLLTRQDFPTTAQPSPEAFLPYFLQAKANGDSLIAILLSGGLSGTVQSAYMAKEMADYANIQVIDSLTATTGMRLLVDIAAQMRREGLDAITIVERIEALKKRVKIIAMVDTLEYLHRGGRLTKAQAKLGEMVNLKVIIGLNQEGKIEARDKCLGKTRAYKSILKFLEAEPYDEHYPVYTPYAHDRSNCEHLIAMAHEQWPLIDYDHLYNIGPTIGTHTGDGALGLTYIVKE